MRSVDPLAMASLLCILRGSWQVAGKEFRGVDFLWHEAIPRGSNVVPSWL